MLDATRGIFLGSVEFVCRNHIVIGVQLHRHHLIGFPRGAQVVVLRVDKLERDARAAEAPVRALGEQVVRGAPGRRRLLRHTHAQLVAARMCTHVDSV